MAKDAFDLALEGPPAQDAFDQALTEASISPEKLRSQTRGGAGIFPEEKLSTLDRAIGMASAIPGPIDALVQLLGTDQMRRATQLQRENLARGALRTVSGGLSDALAKVSGAEVRPEFSPERFAPESALAGEIAGAALPAGRVIGPAQTVGGAIGRSALTGALFGGAGGISSEVEKPSSGAELPTLGETLQASLLPAAAGAGIGALIPGAGALVTRGAQKLGQLIPRVAKSTSEVISETPLNALAHDVMKPSGPAAISDLNRGLETGQFQDVLRNIRKELPEIPKNGLEVVEGAVKAEESLIGKHNNFVKANKDLPPLDNAGVAQQVRDSIAGNELATEEEIRAVNEVANLLEKDRTLDKSFNLLKNFNEKRDKYYKKSAAGQSSDLDDAVNNAYQIARDGLSTNLDKTYQAVSRTTDNPYRQYGALADFNTQLRQRLDKLASDRNIQLSKGIGLDREVISTLRKNIDLLKGGEAARINNRTMKMFEALENSSQPSRIKNLPPGTPEEDLSLLLKEP